MRGRGEADHGHVQRAQQEKHLPAALVRGRLVEQGLHPVDRLLQPVQQSGILRIAPDQHPHLALPQHGKPVAQDVEAQLHIRALHRHVRHGIGRELGLQPHELHRAERGLEHAVVAGERLEEILLPDGKRRDETRRAGQAAHQHDQRHAQPALDATLGSRQAPASSHGFHLLRHARMASGGAGSGDILFRDAFRQGKIKGTDGRVAERPCRMRASSNGNACRPARMPRPGIRRSPFHRTHGALPRP